jgi:hypothetical protein
MDAMRLFPALATARAMLQGVKTNPLLDSRGAPQRAASFRPSCDPALRAAPYLLCHIVAF